MKVNRLSKENDPCETSIEFLVDRCEKFFSNHPELKSEKRYYAESTLQTSFEEKEIVDVVLFGNGYKTIFQSGNWPFKKLRLWVLSQEMKNFFESEFSQGKIKVNLIPRNEIYPVDLDLKFQGTGPVQYIYAGRLSYQKNLKLLLATFNSLREAQPHAELHLFGDFDDTIHENLGRRELSSYKEDLARFSNLQVTFHGKVEKEYWADKEWKNPCFISLSTFLSEDFGVAASQAAEKGWPLILSEFGGHRDISASQVFYIAPELCLNDHLPNALLREVGEGIAERIVTAIFSKSEFQTEITKHEFALDVLDHQRRRWATIFGSSVSLLGYEYLSTFADQPMGRNYLNEFYHFQTGNLPLFSFVGFDFDHHELKNNMAKKVAGILKSHHQKCPFFINSRDLLLKDSIKLCLKSEKIFLLNDTGDAEKWKSFLIEELCIEESKIQILSS